MSRPASYRSSSGIRGKPARSGPVSITYDEFYSPRVLALLACIVGSSSTTVAGFRIVADSPCTRSTVYFSERNYGVSLQRGSNAGPLFRAQGRELESVLCAQLTSHRRRYYFLSGRG
jgi:hypothetical protein